MADYKKEQEVKQVLSDLESIFSSGAEKPVENPPAPIAETPPPPPIAVEPPPAPAPVLDVLVPERLAPAPSLPETPPPPLSFVFPTLETPAAPEPMPEPAPEPVSIAAEEIPVPPPPAPVEIVQAPPPEPPPPAPEPAPELEAFHVEIPIQASAPSEPPPPPEPPPPAPEPAPELETFHVEIPIQPSASPEPPPPPPTPPPAIAPMEAAAGAPPVPPGQIRRLAVFYSGAEKPAFDNFLRFFTDMAQKVSKKPIYIDLVLSTEWSAALDAKLALRVAKEANAVGVICVFNDVDRDSAGGELEEAFKKSDIFLRVVSVSEAMKRSTAVDLVVDLMLVGPK